MSRPTFPSSFLFVVAVAGIAVFLSGCVTASVTRLNGEKRKATNPKDVTIYLKESDIPGEYTEMALIDLSGGATFTNQQDVMNRARKETAEIGGNGVLYKSWEEAGTGEQIASAVFGVPADNDAEMIAIYVQDKAQEGGVASDTTAMKTEAAADSTSNR